MSATLAGPADTAENTELDVSPQVADVREACARLYRQGYPRRTIARLLMKHIVPNSQYTGDDLNHSRIARLKLARWEKEQSFRDLIWNDAVVRLDLKTPKILEGMTKKAIKGNIMAARLALEITGRHNPKGDVAPTQVAVVINGIPRPQVIESSGIVAIGPTVEDED